MNDEQFLEQFQDLKQFIEATVSQTEARLSDRIDSVDEKLEALDKRLSKDIAVLRQETEDGFAGVGEAISTIHDQIEERDKEVDARLTRLEQKAAR